jgi:Fucose permease
MLTALFIVALGFSLQQTGAQPFAISLGDPATGSHRVNLGGGVNSFGTMIGPIVVALALLGSTAVTDEEIKHLNLDKVNYLYMAAGALFLVAALLFMFSKKLPSGKSDASVERSNKATWALVVITILLIAFFTPVFNSYRTEEGKRVEQLQNEIGALSAQVEKGDAPAGLSTELSAKESELDALKNHWKGKECTGCWAHWW